MYTVFMVNPPPRPCIWVEVITDNAEMQRIIRDYYEKLYGNKMDNLEEIEIMNNLITHKAGRILAPRIPPAPGIKPTPPASEGSLYYWTARDAPDSKLLKYGLFLNNSQ